MQGSACCYLKGTRWQTVRTDTDAFLKKANTSWIIFVRIFYRVFLTNEFITVIIVIIVIIND